MANLVAQKLVVTLLSLAIFIVGVLAASEGDKNWSTAFLDNNSMGFSAVVGDYLVSARSESPNGGMALDLNEATVGTWSPGLYKVVKNSDGSYWALEFLDSDVNLVILSSDYQIVTKYLAESGKSPGSLFLSDLCARSSSSVILESGSSAYMFQSATLTGSVQTVPVMEAEKGVFGNFCLLNEDGAGAFTWSDSQDDKFLYGEFVEFGKLSKLYELPVGGFTMRQLGNVPVIFSGGKGSDYSLTVPSFQEGRAKILSFEVGFSYQSIVKMISCGDLLVFSTRSSVWVLNDHFEPLWAKQFSFPDGLFVGQSTPLCGENEDQLFISAAVLTSHNLEQVVLSFDLENPADLKNDNVVIETVQPPSLKSTEEKTMIESNAAKFSFSSQEFRAEEQETTSLFTKKEKIIFSASEMDTSADSFLSTSQ